MNEPSSTTENTAIDLRGNSRLGRVFGMRTPVQVRLLLLSGGHLLNDGAANYLPGILPAVLASLGAPKSQAGVLMGTLLIGQGLQPAIGYLSDRIGGKMIPLAGLGVVSAAGALVGLAPNYGLLILLLLILGLSNSCFHPQALAGVRSLAGSRQGLSTSTFLIGGEIGRGVGPFLAGLIVASWGLPWLWLLAVPAAIYFPLLWGGFPSLPARRRQGPPIRWREHAGPLGRIVLFSGLRITLIFLLITYLPLWWQENGGGILGGSALVAVLYVVGIGGNAAGGHFADQHGFRRVAVLASAASVILLLLLLLLPGPWLWLWLSLLGMALFATLPISISLAQSTLPENPSVGAGIGLGFCNAVGAVMVMGLGLLAEPIGATGMLWLAAGISALALATAPLLPEPSTAAGDESRKSVSHARK